MTSWRSRAALLITHVDDTDLQYCVWVRWQDGKPSPRTDESQTKYRCTFYPGPVVCVTVRQVTVTSCRQLLRTTALRQCTFVPEAAPGLCHRFLLADLTSPTATANAFRAAARFASASAAGASGCRPGGPLPVPGGPTVTGAVTGSATGSEDSA